MNTAWLASLLQKQLGALGNHPWGPYSILSLNPNLQTFWGLRSSAFSFLCAVCSPGPIICLNFSYLHLWVIYLYRLPCYVAHYERVFIDIQLTSWICFCGRKMLPNFTNILNISSYSLQHWLEWKTGNNLNVMFNKLWHIYWDII